MLYIMLVDFLDDCLESDYVSVIVILLNPASNFDLPLNPASNFDLALPLNFIQ